MGEGDKWWWVQVFIMLCTEKNGAVEQMPRDVPWGRFDTVRHVMSSPGIITSTSPDRLCSNYM